MSEVLAQHPHTHARVTRVTTAHGDFLTPAFMPVATRAVLNHMTTEDLLAAGSQIILGGNTYHMLCSPGMEVLRACGGMHRFMHWSGPMLTDSGGYQVFSLSRNQKIATIDQEGVNFRDPKTGVKLRLDAERSIAAQKTIGADIIMAFDQCTPDEADKAEVICAMHRTWRWLERSRNYHAKYPNSDYGHPQALFGIIQGAGFRDLREQCTEHVLGLDFEGIAIGGETVGSDMAKTVEIIDWIRPLLPANKTRYTMGVGLSPQDLLDVIACGIDIFDCVAPTRNARHGALYCGELVSVGTWLRFESSFPRGRLMIRNARFKLDEQPIQPGCACYTCQRYSRAYLHYLARQKLSAYCHFACIHNIHVMHSVCAAVRNCIGLLD